MGFFSTAEPDPRNYYRPVVIKRRDNDKALRLRLLGLRRPLCDYNLETFAGPYEAQAGYRAPNIYRAAHTVAMLIGEHVMLTLLAAVVQPREDPHWPHVRQRLSKILFQASINSNPECVLCKATVPSRKVKPGGV